MNVHETIADIVKSAALELDNARREWTDAATKQTVSEKERKAWMLYNVAYGRWDMARRIQDLLREDAPC